jgi:hypothetical protein
MGGETMNSLLDALTANRDAIAVAEVGALLHDLDKFKQAFLDEPLWHSCKGKYTNENRGSRWAEMVGGHQCAEHCTVDPARLFFEEKDGSKVDIDKSRSVDLSTPFATHHLSCGPLPWVGLLINGGGSGADGIDSDLDKLDGNRLASPRDHKQTGDARQIDTPFGCGTGRTCEDRLDKVTKLVGQWANGPRWPLSDLKTGLREAMSYALGETRYPCNDVTLWAHSHSVATMTKALFAKTLIEYTQAQNDGWLSSNKPYLLPQRTPPEDAKKEKNPTDFTLLRIGWDRDCLIGRAHKAGDVFAVNELLEDLQQHTRQFIEETLLVGNEVYQDESVQLFLLPRLGTLLRDGQPVFPGLHERFEMEIRTRLESEIIEWLVKKEAQETPFDITFANCSDDQEVNPARRIVERTRVLLNQAPCFRQSAKALLRIATGLGPRCEVCGVRPASHRQRFENDNDRLCKSCSERRHDKNRRRDREDLHQTSDLEKMAGEGERNRLALITIAFDLQPLYGTDFFNIVRWQEKTGEKHKTCEKHKHASPGRLSRCYESLASFLKSFLEKTVSTECKEGVFPITLSACCLEFVVNARHYDTIMDCFMSLYESEFGRFRTRLPVSVGAVFFFRKFPLYLAIETAGRLRMHLKQQPGKLEYSAISVEPRTCGGQSGRGASAATRPPDMEEQLEVLLKAPSMTLPSDPAGYMRWNIPCLQSDRQSDGFYHAKTNEGEFVKWNCLSGKQLQVRDGRLDFILLDSPARRFAFGQGERRDHLGVTRKAYPLSIWNNCRRIRVLFEKLEISQRKAIEQALIEKRVEWRDQWRPDCPVVQGFCETILFAPNAFGSRKKDGAYRHLDSSSNGAAPAEDSDREVLLRSAVSGLLLDVLDLYLHVVKAS